MKNHTKFQMKKKTEFEKSFQSKYVREKKNQRSQFKYFVDRKAKLKVFLIHT